MVPVISSDSDPFEEATSSPSSSGLDGDNYALASSGMANGFLSSEVRLDEVHLVADTRVQCDPFFDGNETWAIDLGFFWSM